MKKLRPVQKRTGTTPNILSYNPYGDDSLSGQDRPEKDSSRFGGSVGVNSVTGSTHCRRSSKEWIDDQSKPQVEFDDEEQQSYKQELTNLRVLERLNGLTSDPNKTSATIEEVNRVSMKYIRNDKHDPSWAAQEGPIFNPASNLNLISGMRSMGTSKNNVVRGLGVGFTYIENCGCVKN